MPVYAKRLSGAWKKCFEEYESLCGFEITCQDEIDNGKMTPEELWEHNIYWLQNVLTEVEHIRTPMDL